MGIILQVLNKIIYLAITVPLYIGYELTRWHWK